MSSERKAIRAAMVAALSGKTSAATRVFANRTDPVMDQATDIDAGTEEFPVLLVFTRSETSEVFDESPRRYRRKAEVLVEGTLNAGDQSDDALDDLADEIENAVLVDDTLGGTANDVKLTGTTMVLGSNGRKTIGGVTLTFEVEYFTYAPAAGVQVLDDLGTVNTQYDLNGEQPDTRDRAETIIEGLSQ